MFVGLPLGANPSRLSTWKPLLTSIQGKLGLWKGSLLSMARRIFCLIKSVLSYLPPFYMFVFLMPQSIIKTIFPSWGDFFGVEAQTLVKCVKLHGIRLLN